ncbi:hypothetical protein F5148DRAFT_961781, partial [Russula earlei]
RYDNAEASAGEALVLDPRFTKACYRRGLARKGNLDLDRAAVVTYDPPHPACRKVAPRPTRIVHTNVRLSNRLEEEPNSAEAKTALGETLDLMRARNDEDDVAVFDDETPRLSEPKAELELESVSDSSDWNHDVNGIACRFYNHDGYLCGTRCRLSHAPDYRIVRDRLGRNVCVFLLLGNCKFGDLGCIYSHDKKYLPSE